MSCSGADLTRHATTTHRSGQSHAAHGGHDERARDERRDAARRHLDLPPSGSSAPRPLNLHPSRRRTAPATAPCVARAPAGLLLSHASLRVAAAGARRRLDPCCPCVQVARGGRMEPHMGSWCDPPAQLAAPARPQAWARL